MQWYRRQTTVLSTNDRASVPSGQLLLPLLMFALGCLHFWAGTVSSQLFNRRFLVNEVWVLISTLHVMVVSNNKKYKHLPFSE